MNEGTAVNKTVSVNPPTMSSVDSEIDNINIQLGRLDKTISVCMDNFRRFDTPANKLNPDDYFRNIPHEDKSEKELAAQKPGDAVEPYTRSGTVRRLNELADHVRQLERQVSDFNEYHIIPCGYFFERNI